MESSKSEKVIAKREDGFYIAYGTWKDFPKFKNIVNELSEESKKFYHPWMFKKNCNLKIKVGQFLARISLLPKLGKFIEFIYPYGYAIILKCMSDKNQIVGIISVYNFKRLSNGTFMATHGDMIIDKFQNMGLGSFQRDTMRSIAKQERVSKFWAKVHVINEKSLNNVKKNGWKVVRIEKDVVDYNNEKYDIAEVVKDL